MTWRTILENEHRLVFEVLEAAEKECDYIDATGRCRIDLVGDMLEFFRYFNDGLHDPKEEGLLFARCRKRGMTDEDEPLEQMLGEHQWCCGKLDSLQAMLKMIERGDTALTRGLSAGLREYIDVNRCHIEVEETLFFDMASHYLTKRDMDEVTEEFEAAHFEEVEEGVQAFYQDLAHRVLAAENEVCG